MILKITTLTFKFIKKLFLLILHNKLSEKSRQDPIQKICLPLLCFFFWFWILIVSLRNFCPDLVFVWEAACLHWCLAAVIFCSSHFPLKFVNKQHLELRQMCCWWTSLVHVKSDKYILFIFTFSWVHALRHTSYFFVSLA